VTEWYYGKNGQQHGPVDMATLQRLAGAGELEPTDLVWREGMGQWTEASQVEGLFSMGATEPPVVGEGALVDHARQTSPQAPTIALSYSQAHPSTGTAYVGFWWRVLAAIIDGFVLMVPQCFIGILAGMAIVTSTAAGGHLNQMAVNGLIRLLGAIVAWLYYALMESSAKQATVGKMAIGVRVTDENGARISFARATGRHFGKYLSMLCLGIGFIMVGLTKRKQGLHDLMAKTFVVRGSVVSQQSTYSSQQAYPAY
jgi:uncharacterized RDD family membrane protein YckC